MTKRWILLLALAACRASEPTQPAAPTQQAVAVQEPSEIAALLTADEFDGGVVTAPAPVVEEDPPEVVFDLAEDRPSGAPDYLLDPIASRRGQLRACGRDLEMPETLRDTFYLDDHGSVLAPADATTNELRRCVTAVMRSLRFAIAADVTLTYFYVRFEYAR